MDVANAGMNFNDSIIMPAESHLQSFIEEHKNLNPHILHDFKVLDQLTPDRKLCLVKDENKKSHLDISWFATNTLTGRLLQPTCRFVRDKWTGESNRVVVLQHLQTLLSEDYKNLIIALENSLDANIEAWTTLKKYIDSIEPKINILSQQYLINPQGGCPNKEVTKVEDAYKEMKRRCENAIIEQAKFYLLCHETEKAIEFFKMYPNRLENYDFLEKIICAAPTGEMCDKLINQLSQWAQESNNQEIPGSLKAITIVLNAQRLALQNAAQALVIFHDNKEKAKKEATVYFQEITYPSSVICYDERDLQGRYESIKDRLGL